MSRIIYINGEFVDESEAKISVFDRGFLFADSVYEVSAVLGGKAVDNNGHIERLFRSLKELGIKHSYKTEQIIAAQAELIKQNDLTEGVIYIQVTRGHEERDFIYSADISPNFVMITQNKSILGNPLAESGVKACSLPDIRWKRCDIKSTALLAQVLAKNEAKQKGCFEAWMVDADGFVTEGGSSNAYIVKGGKVITRPPNNQILKGITRTSILDIAKTEGYEVEERKFTIQEAYEADECFLTSASTFVIGITELDSKTIGHSKSAGKVGEITKTLRAKYIQHLLG